MPDDEVLIIGAGPAGLALAHELARLDVRATLLDRGAGPGGAYRCMDPGVLLNSPAGYNGLPGASLEGDHHSRAAEYLEYLEDYHAQLHAASRFECEVTGIDPTDRGYRLSTSDAPASGRTLVMATGMWSHPRREADLGGLETCHEVVHYSDLGAWDEVEDQLLLVIGGGNSALELSARLVERNRVDLWSRSRLKVMPQKILGFDLHVFASWVEALVPRSLAATHCRRPFTQPGFTHWRDAAEASGRFRVLDERPPPGRTPYDRIVLATGWDHRYPLLESDLPHSLDTAGVPLTDGAGASRTHPGLYFLGEPCAFSLASPFLRGIAADAPRLARRIRDDLAGTLPGSPSPPMT